MYAFYKQESKQKNHVKFDARKLTKIIFFLYLSKTFKKQNT